MAAIKGGRTVDTTMGLTPLEGLMMGTRCGDIDPAAVIFMGQKLVGLFFQGFWCCKYSQHGIAVGIS